MCILKGTDLYAYWWETGTQMTYTHEYFKNTLIRITSWQPVCHSTEHSDFCKRKCPFLNHMIDPDYWFLRSGNFPSLQCDWYLTLWICSDGSYMLLESLLKNLNKLSLNLQFIIYFSQKSGRHCIIVYRMYNEHTCFFAKWESSFKRSINLSCCHC